MKKILIAVISVVILLLLLLFIPVTKTVDTTVSSNFDNIVFALKLGNWNKWHPFITEKKSKTDTAKIEAVSKSLFFSDGNDSIRVNSINPLIYVVKQYSKGYMYNYSVEIIPSSSTNTVTLRSDRVVKLLYYMFPSLDKFEGNKNCLAAVKKYTEDPKSIYGFSIKMEKVSDTVFAVRQLTILKKELFSFLPKGFAEIKSYADKNDLEIVNNYSVHYRERNDSLELIIGIPVNKAAAPSENVKCVDIPKGRMLTASYEGSFRERKKIYRALQKYATDHHMANVGASFESYNNNALPSSDSSVVQFKFYFPVL